DPRGVTSAEVVVAPHVGRGVTLTRARQGPISNSQLPSPMKLGSSKLEVGSGRGLRARSTAGDSGVPGRRQRPISNSQLPSPMKLGSSKLEVGSWRGLRARSTAGDSGVLGRRQRPISNSQAHETWELEVGSWVLAS